MLRKTETANAVGWVDQLDDGSLRAVVSSHTCGSEDDAECELIEGYIRWLVTMYKPDLSKCDGADMGFRGSDFV